MLKCHLTELPQPSGWQAAFLALLCWRARPGWLVCLCSAHTLRDVPAGLCPIAAWAKEQWDTLVDLLTYLFGSSVAGRARARVLCPSIPQKARPQWELGTGWSLWEARPQGTGSQSAFEHGIC